MHNLKIKLNHIREYFESKVLDLFALFRGLAKTAANINDNRIKIEYQKEHLMQQNIEYSK